MKKYIKNIKKGFTLVELLAVIAVLGLILILAVPKITQTMENSKKKTLELTAKSIARSAEEKKIENETFGIEEEITCNSISDYSSDDFSSCTIRFDEDGIASVTLVGKGSYKGLNICNGTKMKTTATSEECKLTPAVLNCTFDGDLVQGAEFIHNQYTYRYKQEYNYDENWNIDWQNIEVDGWGVILTDKESTNPVNTPICTYINGKPLVSTTMMFYESAATSIDVSSWNTSTVTNMSGMFGVSAATTLDLSSFDTSNVTDMVAMFWLSAATSLDLSSFDTSNVTDMASMFERSAATTLDLSSFDTSNVTDMNYMFADSAATNLDLSSFDTSKVTDMGAMFSGSAATSIDLSSFDTSNVTDMNSMFSGSAATSLDLSNFDTSNVTDMTYMFRGSAATSLDLSGFDTSNVTDMSFMFSSSAATNLDLSSFDTSNVANMLAMFANSKATTLDLSNFDTTRVSVARYIFDGSAVTNFILGNKFIFLPENSLEMNNWIKTHDVNGNALNDTTQYTTEQLTSFTESTTPGIGGRWNKVS